MSAVIIKGALLTGMSCVSRPPHDQKKHEYYLTLSHGHLPYGGTFSPEPHTGGCWISKFEVSKQDFDRVKEPYLTNGIVGLDLHFEPGLLTVVESGSLNNEEFYRCAL